MNMLITNPVSATPNGTIGHGHETAPVDRVNPPQLPPLLFTGVIGISAVRRGVVERRSRIRTRHRATRVALP